MFSVRRAITLGRILKMGSQVLFGQAALAMGVFGGGEGAAAATVISGFDMLRSL